MIKFIGCVNMKEKRVPNKGGDWGVTGGHPKSGETTREGIITEVKEELETDISNCKLEEFDHGCNGKDCYVMLYTKLNLDITTLDIQFDELTEVKWFSIQLLEKMVENGELNKDQIEFFTKCVDYLSMRQ